MTPKLANKAFSEKSTQSCVWNAMRNLTTPQIGLANEVCSTSVITDRQIDKPTTITLTHASRVNYIPVLYAAIMHLGIHIHITSWD